MFIEGTTETPVRGKHRNANRSRGRVSAGKRRDFAVSNRGMIAAGAIGSRTGTRFLSEYQAAAYLGLLTVHLRGLRIFDLAMIAQGFKPHGPPPLWKGKRCVYSTENLDEWVRDRSDKAGG